MSSDTPLSNGNRSETENAVGGDPAEHVQRETSESSAAHESPEQNEQNEQNDSAASSEQTDATESTGAAESGATPTTPSSAASEARAAEPPAAPPGSTAEAATPVPAEPASAEPAPAEPAPAEAGAGAAEAGAASSKPKLAPQQVETARAIPSLSPDEPARSESGSSDASGATPAPPPPPRQPIEIPRDADLDADLEAEIAAAMSGQLASSEAEAAQPAAGEPADDTTLEPGARLKATVQSVDAENVFFDLGVRSPGVIQIRQFETAKPPEVGHQMDVVVERVDSEDGLIVLALPRGKRRVGGNWDAVAVGQVVDCLVNKTNKGGLEVSISNLRGFLPAGQVDLGYVSDLEQYVGQKLTVQVTEVNPRKRNLVVSRRKLLEAERQDAQQDFWDSVEVGQTFSGRVKTIKDYGAFVDLGAVDGFLHIGEISWSRIGHPRDVLEEGQTVDVKVISLDPEKQRIGLGMRQLSQDPWNLAGEKYAAGKAVHGRVTRTAAFGAFVELEPGIEGLVHISELDYRRVNRVTDVLNVGQTVELQVLEVDTDRKRISLSLKALKPKPETAQQRPAREDVPESEPYERKRRGPLKGGMGGAGRGGLFGDPKDYE